MKRKLPQSLIDRQEKERAATVDAVTDAAIMLQSQGCYIRIKDIMDITGLSRSVFSKPYVRRVLVEYGAVAPKEVIPENVTGKTRRDIETILAEKDGYIDRLLSGIEYLRQECEILRGQIHLLTHRKSAENEIPF